MKHVREGLASGDYVMIGDWDIPKLIHYSSHFSLKQKRLVVKILNDEDTSKSISDIKEGTQPFTHYDSKDNRINHYHIELDTVREIHKQGWITTTVLIFNIVDHESKH